MIKDARSGLLWRSGGVRSLLGMPERPDPRSGRQDRPSNPLSDLFVSFFPLLLEVCISLYACRRHASFFVVSHLTSIGLGVDHPFRKPLAVLQQQNRVLVPGICTLYPGIFDALYMSQSQ